jgi:hypothetical protein
MVGIGSFSPPKVRGVFHGALDVFLLGTLIAPAQENDDPSSILKIIDAVSRTKVNLHFPYFGMDVTNPSEVSVFQPINPRLNQVCRPAVP